MATWARQKVWNFGDILTSGDLNNEFNNILNAGTFDFTWTGVQTFAAGVAKFKGIGVGIATVTNANTTNNNIFTIPDTGGNAATFLNIDSTGNIAITNPTTGDITATLAGASATISFNLISKADSSGLIVGPSAATAAAFVKIGFNSSGDRGADVFLRSDDTFTTYGLRLNRSAGANGDGGLYFRGTGNLNLSAEDNGSVAIYTGGAGTPRFRADATGLIGVNVNSPTATLDVTQLVKTSGNPIGLQLTGGAHTGLTASAEIVDVNINLARTVQRATGAVATQRAVRIQAPTYSFVGASTITNAYTFYVDGAPAAGANATITNKYAAYFGGAARIDQDSTSLLVSGSAVGPSIQLANAGTGKADLALSTGNNQYVTGSVSDDVILRVNSSGGNLLFVTNTSSLISAESSNLGNWTFTQGAASSGNPTHLTLASAAHTGLTASAEVIDVNLNLARTVQRATGAVATQRAVLLQAPTYSFVGASTITNAVTFEISGAPAAGANATITNNYALRVAAGTCWLKGNNLFGPSSTTLGSSYPVSTGDNLGKKIAAYEGSGQFYGIEVQANEFRLHAGTSGSTNYTWYSNNAEMMRLVGTGGDLLINTTTDDSQLSVNQRVVTSGNFSGINFTGAAHTGLTASAEIIDVNINLNRTVQRATGAVTNQRAFQISAPTYSFVGASTITNSATFYVSGSPIAGTNATLTNSYSAWFGSKIRIDAQIALGGGAAPTLGTIGGSGPATAAQNSWLELWTASGKRFVPLWA